MNVLPGNRLNLSSAVLLALTIGFQTAYAGPPFDIDEVLKKEAMIPKGTTYEAVVPFTLDIAEQAKWSLNALIGNMEPDYHYGVYQGFWLLAGDRSDPKNLFQWAANPFAVTWNITVKNARTIPQMRSITGSDFGLDHEYNMMKEMLGAIRDDGLLYYAMECQGPPMGTSYPQTNASMMFVMMNRQGIDGNPAWDKWINLMAKGLRNVAIKVEDRAFYPMQAGITPEGEWRVMNSDAVPPYTSGKHDFEYDPLEEPKSDAMGYEGAAKAEANRAMAALSKHYRRTGDKDSMEMATRIYKFGMKPGMWSDNIDEKRYPGYEHGIWMGHFHNGTQALLGLLDYATATNSDWVKEFCREFHENTRRNGIVRMGWLPCWSAPEGNGDRPSNLGELTEPCAIGDFICDSVLMSDYGLGDYWDDVDSFVRNHLVEQQITDIEQMRKFGGVDPGSEEHHRLMKFAGGFGGCTPTHLWTNNIAGCCTVNGAQGFYYAWHGITRFDQGIATVNLFLNRASPWMDIDSYVPYEGKVVLHNKKAHTALVRIPSWVDQSAVQAFISSGDEERKSDDPPSYGNRLLFENLKEGDDITLEFPVRETTDKYTINGKEYTVKFRGSTVVDIGPRDEDDPGSDYLLYQREHLTKYTKAPMRKVTRFVTDTVVPLGTF